MPKVTEVLEKSVTSPEAHRARQQAAPEVIKPQVLMWVDEKTFQVYVKHTPGKGFIPDENTIAIEKYSELIRQQLDEFIAKQHDPMVRQLLEMVAKFNRENNQEYVQAASRKVIEMQNHAASRKVAEIQNTANMKSARTIEPTKKSTKKKKTTKKTSKKKSTSIRKTSSSTKKKKRK